ncbi:MAG: hypothetical protein FJ106_00765 [Deltaproteobacteria bacterium]|nr:hypothetical protein [Deltaproteobacteria bacterium]
MIDKRELLDKARERNLTLGIIEKDYVLGWMLIGLGKIKGLTFKGGTALSKVYFPRLWRLSEDLDFVFEDDFKIIVGELTKLKMNKVRLKALLEKKFQYKGIESKSLDDMFPYDLLEILEGYWERELGRLVHPVPEMKKVISDVRDHLEFLKKSI